MKPFSSGTDVEKSRKIRFPVDTRASDLSTMTHGMLLSETHSRAKILKEKKKKKKNFERKFREGKNSHYISSSFSQRFLHG